MTARIRTIRISDKLWTQASTKARSEDITPSQLIRDCLADYVMGYKPGLGIGEAGWRRKEAKERKRAAQIR